MYGRMHGFWMLLFAKPNLPLSWNAKVFLLYPRPACAENKNTRSQLVPFWLAASTYSEYDHCIVRKFHRWNFRDFIQIQGFGGLNFVISFKISIVLFRGEHFMMWKFSKVVKSWKSQHLTLQSIPTKSRSSQVWVWVIAQSSYVFLRHFHWATHRLWRKCLK